MRKIFLIIAIAFGCSCSGPEDYEKKGDFVRLSDFNILGNTKNLEKGIALQCMETNNTGQFQLIFGTRTLDQSLYIELWNGYVHKSKCDPFLVAKNGLGEPIDTLKLVKRHCYFGTDSSYNPFLEIKTDRTIIVKDSSNTVTDNGFKTITADNGDLVVVSLGKSVSYVSTQVYQISTDGIIEQIDYQYVEYDL